MSTLRAEEAASTHALLVERLLNARRTHLVRLIALSFFACLFLVLGVGLDDRRWQVSPWPLAIGLTAAAAVFVGQRRGERTAAWLTLAPAVLDVPLIFIVQRAQFDESSASGVAGFSLGLYGLVLGIAALSMGRRQLYVTAASAAAFEVWLQHDAGVSIGAQLASVVVLALLAQLLAYAGERRRYLVMQAARTEKLAAVGQLAAAVGHDLRNPLAAVTNAVFVLRRRLDKAGALTPQVLEPLQLAEREIDATRRIVTDLLDFTRQGAALERTAVELRGLLDECVSLVKPRAGVSVEVSLDPALAVLGARDRLRQVFVNLVQNAVEAIPEGRGGRVVVRAHAARDRVTVEVQDDGAGMDEATRARVLEPLFTTKKDGTGLGLAIVEGMVQQHEGSLRIDSTLGQGTTVTVELRRAETFKAARV